MQQQPRCHGVTPAPRRLLLVGISTPPPLATSAHQLKVQQTKITDIRKVQKSRRVDQG